MGVVDGLAALVSVEGLAALVSSPDMVSPDIVSPAADED